MLIVGLTGNYGMGKSYVLSMFKGLGALTLDSDKIVDSLLKDKVVINKIIKIFGRDVLEKRGRLDKNKIAIKTFKNTKIRRKLEVLLHPLVFDRIQAFIKKIQHKKCMLLVEVPLLFEGRYQGRFDKIITVYTTLKTAIERLNNSGVSHTDAVNRLKAQMPVKIKKEFSDFLIDNNGTKKDTRKQVAKIYKLLLQEIIK